MQSCSKSYRVLGMNLLQYLASPGALTVAQLRAAIGAASDAQIRQWQHGYADRRPSAKYAKRIEKVTKGAVTERELRPDDFDSVLDAAPQAAAKEVTHG